MPTRLNNTCTMVNVDVDMPKIMVSVFQDENITSVVRQTARLITTGCQRSSKSMDPFWFWSFVCFVLQFSRGNLGSPDTSWNRG